MKVYQKLFIILSIFISSYSFAQNSSQTVTATIVLNEVFGIQIQEGKNISFDFTKREDFDNGVIKEKATTIAVNATGKWKVQFDSNGKDYFDSGKPENQNTMPVNALSVKESTSSDFIPLTNNGTTLKSSSQRGKNLTYTLDYKAKPDWTTPVDAYSTVIRFTISPN